MKKLMDPLNRFQNLAKLVYKNNWRYVWAVVVMCTIVFVFDALSPSVMTESIFRALSLEDTQYLMKICMQIALSLGCMLLMGIVFFTYTDAWFILISNRSCSILFQELFKMPHADVFHQFSDGEIYNRLVMGATHTMSVLAASTQCLSTAASSIVLLLMMVRHSYQFLGIGVIYFLVIAVRTALETRKNMAYQMNIQQAASKQTQQVHVLLENLESAQMYGMASILEEQWMDYRKTYWAWKNRRDRLKALLDFISAVAFGGFQSAICWIFQVINPAIAAITSIMMLSGRYRENLMIACENTANLPSYFAPIHRLSDFLQKYRRDGIRGAVRDRDGHEQDILSLFDVNLTVNGNHILKKINFSIKRNEKVALIGQNGSGKSTVLKAITGQFCLDGGEVCIYAENADDPVSYIPVTAQLFSVAALDNILMGIASEGTEYRDKIELDFLDRTATQLSGGQQQRVNIWRAVVGDRELLLADEPTSALNPELKHAYMDFILHSPSAVVVVTHDPTVLSWFDKIIIVDHGTVAECGEYSEVIRTDAYLRWVGSLSKAGSMDSVQ